MTKKIQYALYLLVPCLYFYMGILGNVQQDFHGKIEQKATVFFEDDDYQALSRFSYNEQAEYKKIDGSPEQVKAALVEGVQIAEVKQGSVLDSAGILPGDSICSVNGSPVDGDGMLFRDVSLCDYLEKAKQGESVNLGVYRVQTQEKDTIVLEKSEHGFSVLKNHAYDLHKPIFDAQLEQKRLADESE